MKIKIIFTFTLFLAIIFSQAIFAESKLPTNNASELSLSKPAEIENICANYPHWNCKNPDENNLLTRIEDLIKKYPQGAIVAFDWDGTLYSERIPNPDNKRDKRAGESSWHIWGANHLNQYDFLFPTFKTDDNIIAKQAYNIKIQDYYLEGNLIEPGPDKNKIPLTTQGYTKYSQIAKFESGMTPAELQIGINQFLHDYPPQKYAFLKMLDIMQRFANTGFKVWIITGSNQYYVANVINDQNGINATLGYNLFIDCLPNQELSSKCYIAGNSAKIATDTGKFTNVYEDKFVNKMLKANERIAIDAYGKQLALEQIAFNEKYPVIFYAGNSDGDYYGMNYTLSNSDDAIGIFVNPPTKKESTMKQLLDSETCAGRCFAVKINS